MMRAPDSSPGPDRLAVGPWAFSRRSQSGQAYALRSCRRFLPWVARRPGQGRLSRYSNPMMGFANVAEGHTTSVFQDAVRLLLLITVAAEPLPSPRPPDAPAESVAVLRSQVLLQKLDFWLRNPDYLADELLSRFETEGNEEDLELARQILESDEPEVRSYQMLRHLFGAYEPLDEALSVLRTPGLIVRRRQGVPGHTAQHNYYLTSAGREAAATIVSSVPELKYYVDRSKLVADLAGGRRGSALRDIQYLQPEYAGAEVGTLIAGIADRTRTRLQRLLDAQGRDESR